MSFDLTVSMLGGISLIEASSQRFDGCDIFELVGRDRYVATFGFVPETQSAATYGPAIDAVVYYPPKEREALIKGELQGAGRVRLDAFRLSSLGLRLLQDLKYKGVLCEEISAIRYVPFKPSGGDQTTIERDVPGYITLPFESSGDPREADKLFVSLITMKANRGTALIPYEREKYVGIVLGEQGGRIQESFLSHFGFAAETALQNVDLAFHFYRTRTLLGDRTPECQTRLEDLRVIRRTQSLIAIVAELRKTQVDDTEIGPAKEALAELFAAVDRFEPSVLLSLQSAAVYWDIRGYAHIALRHVRRLQLGVNRAATPLIYKFSEMRLLVQKALDSIKEELELHFRECKGKPFSRHGGMSIFFDGHYYAVRIHSDGRLEMFYPLSAPKRAVE